MIIFRFSGLLISKYRVLKDEVENDCDNFDGGKYKNQNGISDYEAVVFTATSTTTKESEEEKSSSDGNCHVEESVYLNSRVREHLCRYESTWLTFIWLRSWDRSTFTELATVFREFLSTNIHMESPTIIAPRISKQKSSCLKLSSCTHEK